MYDQHHVAKKYNFEVSIKLVKVNKIFLIFKLIKFLNITQYYCLHKTNQNKIKQVISTKNLIAFLWRPQFQWMSEWASFLHTRGEGLSLIYY